MTAQTSPPLHIVLFEPEIPHNTGAVGRTCVGLGAKLWLVRPMGFQLTDRLLKRAGLDYWPYLNYEIVNNWDALMSRLEEETGKTPAPWLFTSHAATDYTTVKYQHGDVLLFGSESRGVPDFVRQLCAQTSLRIPVAEEARCLNLSVSVGIAAYEAIRQLNGRR